MNITLIGMSGVGKSVVGKELAKKINFGFMDTDNIIEKKNNLELQKVFQKFGKQKFLELEEKTVLGINYTDKLVISTGGSVVYSKKAMSYLKAISKIVFLDSALKDIKKRIPDFSTRGIVGLENSLEKLFNERYTLYKNYAEIIIEVPKNFDVNIIVNEIIMKLHMYDKISY